MNYLHYRLAGDYESHHIRENFETKESTVISFTKESMKPIFQSGNAHVYDSSTNLYLAEYAFEVHKGQQMLYIHGNGYYPKNTRGTMGKTMMRQRYTLCEVSGDGPFQSSILASTYFIAAGSEGYAAEGTYTNKVDKTSLSVKANGDVTVDFGKL